MKETVVDPETGWLVTRETVVKSSYEFVEESITDPQTGQVYREHRSSLFLRDIGAWVRRIVRERESAAQSERVTDACRRVVLIVYELHKLGYERLRLAPGMSPSGCHWRGTITPISNISRGHGARMKEFRSNAAHYSSGQGVEFFGWKDATDNSPAELASKFLVRFADIAAQGLGNDRGYAESYAAMVKATAPHGLVYAYSDWGDTDSGSLPALGVSREVIIALPPPGEAD